MTTFDATYAALQALAAKYGAGSAYITLTVLKKQSPAVRAALWSASDRDGLRIDTTTFFVERHLIAKQYATSHGCYGAEGGWIYNSHGYPIVQGYRKYARLRHYEIGQWLTSL